MFILALVLTSGIDGSGMVIIISNVGVCDGLAVEWRTSQLNWTDTTHDKISISDLAGNNQRTLFSSGLDEPRDIALDPDSGRVVMEFIYLSPVYQPKQPKVYNCEVMLKISA